VVAIVELAGDGRVVIASFASVTPGATVPAPESQQQQPAARPGRLLVSTDLPCDVSIDFKKMATLPAGGHTTLDVEPGERVVSAVTPAGAAWKKTVKVGNEQSVVDIVLAGVPVPASAAQFDQAAAALVAGLANVRGAGGHVAWVLEKKAFGFHDVQLTVPLQLAATSLKRELDKAQALQPPDDGRRRARDELARAAGEAAHHAALLTEAVTTAQQQNTAQGPAAQQRAQALALVPLMAPEAAALSALQGSEDFRKALPRDRWSEGGLPADPQDFRLGADYDGDRPPRLGALARGGLAESLGLRPGDRVLSVDGRALQNAWDLKLALRAAAGRTAQLEVEREGKRDTRKVAVPATLPR
jgi:membrane-associated protease RseP (regulator of RpoE activity)